jgi:SAM-dependent methyltransferase
VPTPARSLALSVRAGIRLLSADGGTWVDGGEGAVRERIAAASDLSSLSDELNQQDESWEIRYHLSAARANLVRPLALAPDARVLEIGAGCGAVTRHLGERCAVVDAVEPTPARAEVAALRTRDLESVALFAGWLEEIPREPAYDVVILVGVLEYVGGRDGLEDRVRMLAEAAARLRPGGTVACAIENRLGVEYLAGAPEEHLGVAFDGVNGYPRPGPARTFSRPELESLFRAAGLAPQTLHVFPDYKFARVLYADSLLDSAAAALAWRAPTFPSRASPHPRPRLASEERLWRSLVDAGAGGQCANSFLVLGTPGGASPLWPGSLHAAFYSERRRAAYACESRVTGDPAAPAVERRRLMPATARSGTLTHRAEGSEWREGTPLIELLEDGSDSDLARHLQRWRHSVEATPADPDGANIDHGPHNVLVAGDSLLTIDAEWFDSGYAPGDVVARGLLHAAMMLADRRAPECWPEGSETVQDVLTALAELAGAPIADFEAVLRREAELLADVEAGPVGSPEWTAGVQRSLAHLRAALERPLDSTALARREPADADIHERAAGLHRDVDWLHAEVARRDRRIAELEAALGTVVDSRFWRLTQLRRRIAASARGRRS